MPRRVAAGPPRGRGATLSARSTRLMPVHRRRHPSRLAGRFSSNLLRPPASSTPSLCGRGSRGAIWTKAADARSSGLDVGRTSRVGDSRNHPRRRAARRRRRRAQCEAPARAEADRRSAGHQGRQRAEEGAARRGDPERPDGWPVRWPVRWRARGGAGSAGSWRCGRRREAAAPGPPRRVVRLRQRGGPRTRVLRARGGARPARRDPRGAPPGRS